MRPAANWKLTPKQDRFCQAYIETGNASEAYRLAYDAGKMKPNTIGEKAYELISGKRGGGRIAARIKELQAAHVDRHNVTVDSLTRELDGMLDLAEKNENPSAGVSAIMGKARIHGLLAEDRPNERDPIRDMSGEELKKRINELQKKR